MRACSSLFAAMALAGLAGCAAPHALAAMPEIPPASASAAPADNRTRVRGEGAELQVTFEWDEGARTLDARYVLRNTGAQALMVFDRGDRQAVLGGRLDAGAVPPPLVEATADGITLWHRALPLPRPAPTVPPVPLASRVEPGATLEGTFRYAALLEAPRRLRWCLGVMPFDAAVFTADEASAAGVWRASFAAAARQATLCTPWFDAASERFER